MIIFIPMMIADEIRKCSFYDGTYNYLKDIGFECINKYGVSVLLTPLNFNNS